MINFPASPTVGQTHTVGSTTWTWNGVAWTASGTNQADLDARFVNVIGDTMTGALFLSGAPTEDLHASSKKYVDDAETSIMGLVAQEFVAKSGSTMDGYLTLSGAPIMDLHAATKQYVDDSLGDDVLVFDFSGGALTANAELSVIMVHDVSIPNNFQGSRTGVLTNPATDFVVGIRVSGVQIGSLTISTTGVAIWAFVTPGSARNVSAGSRVSMHLPAAIPANLAGFSASILTNRMS